jgi:hypothetical protein
MPRRKSYADVVVLPLVLISSEEYTQPGLFSPYLLLVSEARRFLEKMVRECNIYRIREVNDDRFH